MERHTTCFYNVGLEEEQGLSVITKEDIKDIEYAKLDGQ
jgi:hypothetical protein